MLDLCEHAKTWRKITIGIAVTIQAAIELLLRLMKVKIASGEVNETRKTVMIGSETVKAMKCVFRKSLTVLL
jgi:hypothetical protein